MEEKEVAAELKLVRLQLVELSKAVIILLQQFYHVGFESDESPDLLSVESHGLNKEDKKQEQTQLELELPDEEDKPDKFFKCPSYIG